MKKIAFYFLVAATCAAAVSCKKDNDDRFKDNQTFVNEASSSNQFEIQAGALASTRATNAEVKSFGVHMVTDHGAVGQEMATLVQQKGWSMPADLLPKHKSKIDSLSALSGAAFDKKFMTMMVMSHKEAIDLFSRASDNESGVRDPDLRNFAGAKLPALRMHLEHATSLNTRTP
ncbi:hypothetical protein C7T94_08835 [Pedobacter yulinensis]|uniref:DUF4142 domain-containing protein n=1 Tax=Pedobacter yulinensis TaxID=2126353 RepID=A0A2T3HJX0_9SPHI|nr:DUF4142 domain-containing protein [Pedobacter yulinensis]PST82747.1 hypothetical protein C7T94_08835 [Pedobacter yulinensis]